MWSKTLRCSDGPEFGRMPLNWSKIEVMMTSKYHMKATEQYYKKRYDLMSMFYNKKGIYVDPKFQNTVVQCKNGVAPT